MIDENEKTRRGLPVQGNDGDEFNFIQLLRLQSETFPELAYWLSKNTKRYTSHDVRMRLYT